MTDPTAFLLARIAEDEAAAQAVVDDMPRWDSPSWEDAALEVGDSLPGPRFNARMSPARLLAECAAKRRIVELHGQAQWLQPAGAVVASLGRRLVEEWVHLGGCIICAGDNSEATYPCDTLRFLASVYADHPNYRQEWRP